MSSSTTHFSRLPLTISFFRTRLGLGWPRRLLPRGLAPPAGKACPLQPGRGQETALGHVAHVTAVRPQVAEEETQALVAAAGGGGPQLLRRLLRPRLLSKTRTPPPKPPLSPPAPSLPTSCTLALHLEAPFRLLLLFSATRHYLSRCWRLCEAALFFTHTQNIYTIYRERIEREKNNSATSMMFFYFIF